MAEATPVQTFHMEEKRRQYLSAGFYLKISVVALFLLVPFLFPSFKTVDLAVQIIIFGRPGSQFRHPFGVYGNSFLRARHVLRHGRLLHGLSARKVRDALLFQSGPGVYGCRHRLSNPGHAHQLPHPSRQSHLFCHDHPGHCGTGHCSLHQTERAYGRGGWDQFHDAGDFFGGVFHWDLHGGRDYREDHHLLFYPPLLPGPLSDAMLRFTHSPLGRVLQAIRDNTQRAEALGNRTFVYQSISITFGCVMAAIIGGSICHVDGIRESGIELRRHDHYAGRPSHGHHWRNGDALRRDHRRRLSENLPDISPRPSAPGKGSVPRGPAAAQYPGAMASPFWNPLHPGGHLLPQGRYRVREGTDVTKEKCPVAVA